ncbi:uncharacterized protein [Apostichopus japonicus]|uniref:uncharacterized protein isoform X2 n=1 Tax=Stichopus japonicus TaxID=307972 RepID=UPI003AB337FF
MTSHPPFHLTRLTVLICVAAILFIKEISGETTTVTTQIETIETAPSTVTLTTLPGNATTASTYDGQTKETLGPTNIATATEGTNEYTSSTELFTMLMESTSTNDITSTDLQTYLTNDMSEATTTEQTSEAPTTFEEVTSDSNQDGETTYEYSTEAPTTIEEVTSDSNQDVETTHAYSTEAPTTIEEVTSDSIQDGETTYEYSTEAPSTFQEVTSDSIQDDETTYEYSTEAPSTFQEVTSDRIQDDETTNEYSTEAPTTFEEVTSDSIQDGETTNEYSTEAPTTFEEAISDSIQDGETTNEYSTMISAYSTVVTDITTITEYLDATSKEDTVMTSSDTTTEYSDQVELTSVSTEMVSGPCVEDDTTENDQLVTQTTIYTEKDDLVTIVTELETQTTGTEMTMDDVTNDADAQSRQEPTTPDKSVSNGGITEINYVSFTEAVQTTTASSGQVDITVNGNKPTQTASPNISSNNTGTSMAPNNVTNIGVDLRENYVFFQLRVDRSVNITDQSFVTNLENGLAEAVSLATNNENIIVRRKRFSRFEWLLYKTLVRHNRATNDEVRVQIQNITRNQVDPTTVDTYFTVELNGTVLTSADAASKFTDMSSSRLSAALGYEVLTVPVAANLPESTAPSTITLGTPTGDLQDFLMIILLVPLNIDITGAPFQTDISLGLEAIYLAGMTSSKRKRRDDQAQLDGRIIRDTENGVTRSERNAQELVNERETKLMSIHARRWKMRTFLDGRVRVNEDIENGRHRRQVIDDPSQKYAVNLKSVNRPKPNQMEVEVVFGVRKNGEIVKGKDALSSIDKQSLRFMTTVLGYQVKEPGVTLFADPAVDHTLWIIIVADVVVVVILLFILLLYCLCKTDKKAETHKQAIMSKMDRSTSIEMGFVRIGVQSTDQMSIQETKTREKSGAHAMHGTVRDKLSRKRQRKRAGSSKQTNMNIDSSSEEETEHVQQTVRPSQMIGSQNRVHPSNTTALVVHSGNDDDYSTDEYTPKFKKRDHDEQIKRQQQLQAKLNEEMASRLGAAKSEKSGFQQQVDELLEGASNFNITDNKRKETSKRKRKTKERGSNYYPNESNRSLEDSVNPRKGPKMENPTVAADQKVATEVTIPMSMTTPTKNSSHKSTTIIENNNNTEEPNQEKVYRELRRKWKKERKRINRFLDDAFMMTTSLLDKTEQSRVISLGPPPTSLPPIRQTHLTIPPSEPSPYLYRHSLGPAYYRPLPVYPNVIEDNGYSNIGLYQYKKDSNTEEVRKKEGEYVRESNDGGERSVKHKVDWTNSMKIVQPLRIQAETRSSRKKEPRRKKRRPAETSSC